MTPCNVALSQPDPVGPGKKRMVDGALPNVPSKKGNASGRLEGVTR
jgi:hypothetical protein